MRTLSLDGDRRIPAIGAGDVSLTRSAARGVDAGEVERALHAAIDAGVELIELAAEPDVEQLAGNVVKVLRARDRLVVATRVPAIAAAAAQLPARLPVRYLQERIDASLRATKLEVLPLVLVELDPAWRGTSPWPELVGTCAKLVRDGKVLRWGAWLGDDAVAAVAAEVAEAARAPEGADREDEPEQPHERARGGGGSLLASVGSSGLVVPVGGLDLGGGLAPDVLARLLAEEAVAAPAGEAPPTKPRAVRAIRGLADEPWLVALSAPLSLCERAALPLAGGRLAMLARRPLAGGALAGTLGPGVKLARTDDRNVPDAQLEAFAIGAARLALLVKQAPPAATSCERASAELDRGMPTRPETLEAMTIAELALRFVIDRGAVAMPRLHRAAHVVEAMAAALAAPLSAELHARLDSLEF